MRKDLAVVTFDRDFDLLVADLNDALAALRSPLKIRIAENNGDTIAMVIGKGLTEKAADDFWQEIQADAMTEDDFGGEQ